MYWKKPGLAYKLGPAHRPEGGGDLPVQVTNMVKHSVHTAAADHNNMELVGGCRPINLNRKTYPNTKHDSRFTFGEVTVPSMQKRRDTHKLTLLSRIPLPSVSYSRNITAMHRQQCKTSKTNTFTELKKLPQ